MSEATTRALDDFEIQAITTAYEQGFGHAWRTELSNPYPEGTTTRTAWQYGRDAGQRQTPQPAPSSQPAVPVVSDGVTREQINALLNDDSQDSKEMHDFARAILALRQAVEPMTPEQINEMALQEEFLLVCDGVEELTEIVRAVEAHHFGITAKAEGGA